MIFTAKEFEYGNNACIIYENENFAVLYKPRGMPSAPLKEYETGTLLGWFLNRCPKAKCVIGKKKIEAGLLHRLDTATCGLVLIAKHEISYRFLADLQNAGRIEKLYFAFCTPLDKLNKNIKDNLPYDITSRFRPFGVSGKKVKPLFKDMKDFKKGRTDYTTTIISIESCGKVLGIKCKLTKGHRHQIRSHLALIGCPIYADALYNPFLTEIDPIQVETHTYPLQLYASGLSIYTDGKTKDFDEEMTFTLPCPLSMLL